MKKHLLVSALSLASLLAAPAWAESTLTGGSPASARLDISVVIPQVLFLRVGTGSDTATGGSIDTLIHTVPAANLGDGTPITAPSGDQGSGMVTVRAYGNFGNISLNSNTTGHLTNTTSDTIPWSEINVVPGTLTTTTPGFTNAAIPHPAFLVGPGAGSGTATTLTATNKVVRVEGKWTYSYKNTNAVAAGTYGGSTASSNGRVTYTATQL